MSTIKSLSHFIGVFADVEAKRQEKADERGWYPFVTVSRQAGAGGHALAEALVDKFKELRGDPLYNGWQVLDKELCRQVAENSGLRVSIENLLDERYRSSIEDYFRQCIAGESPQIVVLRRVFEIIQSVASFGKAVIVGRGGNFITRGMPRGVHVRLIAPLEKRIPVMAQRFEVNEDEARDRIREIDAHRAALIRDYFNADIEDPMQYDAVWNTGACSIDFIASAIGELVRRKAEMEVEERELV